MQWINGKDATPESIDRAITEAAIACGLPDEAILIPESVESVRFEHILSAVSKYRGVSRSEILGRDRTNRVARARQEVAYLAKMTLSEISSPQIAAYLKRECHTTILHAFKAVEERELTPQYAREIDEMQLAAIRDSRQ